MTAPSHRKQAEKWLKLAEKEMGGILEDDGQRQRIANAAAIALVHAMLAGQDGLDYPVRGGGA